MDLRLFYQKLRKIEQEITDPHVLVVSHETPDGGRAGQKSEVTRSNAARLIVEGRARLASAEEAAEYHAGVEQARQEADQRSMAQKIQVNVVSEADFRAIKNASRPEKR
jgi:thiamine monophosphate synthase